MKLKKFAVLCLSALMIFNVTGCATSEEKEVVDLLELGYEYLEDEEYDDAMDAFEDALDENEYLWEAYTGLMLAMQRNAEPQEEIYEVVSTALTMSVKKEGKKGIDKEEVDALVEMYETSLEVTTGDDEMKLEILITTNDVLKEENELHDAYIEHLEIMAQKYWNSGDKEKAEELMGRLEAAGVKFELVLAYAEENGLEFSYSDTIYGAALVYAKDVNGNYSETLSQYYDISDVEMNCTITVTPDDSKEGYVNVVVVCESEAVVTAYKDYIDGTIHWSFSGMSFFDYYSGKNIKSKGTQGDETYTSNTQIEWNGEVHEIEYTSQIQWHDASWSDLGDGSYQKIASNTKTMYFNVPEDYDGLCIVAYVGEREYQESDPDDYIIKDEDTYLLEEIAKEGDDVGDYVFVRLSDIMVGY